MNTKFQISIFLLLFAFVGFQGCHSALELAETGNYDEAIDLTLRKLAGKKKKKAELVAALEHAFKAANQEDLREAARLKAEYRASNWPKVYSIYRDIQRRQDRVRPLLPLIDKEGFQADIPFAKVDQLALEAKKGSADYYYNLGLSALQQARSGNRMAARDAFEQFNKIDRYFKSFRDEHQLIDEALDLGRSYVLVKTTNRAPVIVTHAFNEALLSMDVSRLNDRWREFHTNPQRGFEYDYEVEIELNQIDVSPERIQERQYEETKEIEDGFDYVLDENGNVKKDSTGNDIKVPKKVIIRAQVLEALQTKAAYVAGQIAFYDRETNQILMQHPFDAEVLFEHYASTFRGDRRALTQKSRRYCDNSPIPFPSDEALLLDATDKIKSILKREIRDNRRMM